MSKELVTGKQCEWDDIEIGEVFVEDCNEGALETMDQTIDRYKVMCLKLCPSVAKDEAKEIQEKIKVEWKEE